MATPQSVLQEYRQQFGDGARVFFSPGRINLLGEHVDYNGGYVLPAAINKGIWFAVAPNNTNEAKFIAADLNEAFNVDLDQIAKLSGWQNYVLGVLFILLKEKHNIRGFNCVFGGNVPQGSGLSSSAALEAGLIFSLNELFNLGLNRALMAQLAQQAEHSFPGTKCGIMDMFASLHGKEGHCLILDCISLNFEYLPLLLNDYELVLINSKVHHNLNDGGYNKRFEEAMEGLSYFQSINKLVTSFRHVSVNTVNQFKDHLPAKVYDRCLYITQEIERTKQAATYLKENNLIEFGKLMYQTHKGLCELYEVSCSELDYLVSEAKFKYDVIGSRMMGGGFGGCTINLVHKEKREEVINDIVTSYQHRFNVQAEVYLVETADGTKELDVNRL